jgi:hypothetical protein
MTENGVYYEVSTALQEFVMKCIYKEENDFYLVTVFSDGKITIENKIDSRKYSMNSTVYQEEGTIDEGSVWYRNERTVMEQYRGQLKATLKDGVLIYTLFDCANNKRGCFACKIILDNKWIRFNICSVDETLESLAFPASIESKSLVLPLGQGKWIREPQKKRFFHPAIGQGVGMRWFGGLENDNGWICIFSKGAENAGVLTTGLEITPVWLKSLGKWHEEKEVSYSFVEKDNYVALAKIFRQYAKENALFKSLKEKIRDNPEVAKITKGRNIYLFLSEPIPPQNSDLYNEYCRTTLEGMPGAQFKDYDAHENTLPTKDYFSYARVLEILEYLDHSGHLGHVHLGGWLNSGYDGRFPDIWPFNDSLGTPDEFKRIFEKDRKYAVALHDNYQDMYKISPSFPEGLVINMHGHIMRGGVWSNQQSYIINARNGCFYQKRNWEKLKELGVKYIYTDVLTATNMYESYEEGNELTKTECLQNRAKMLEFYVNNNIVASSEDGMDFGIPYISFFPANTVHEPGVTIPLFGLVYHDCVVLGNGAYKDLGFNNPNEEGSYPSLLHMMLWGVQLHFWTVGEKGWKNYLAIEQKTKYLDEWFEKIALDEMISHRYLSDDFLTEETVFESGNRIVCNFSDESRRINGDIIPAFGYRIYG